MSRPQLTPRLIAIRQAVARGEYSCLADGGEAEVFAYARRCGTNAAALLHSWADEPSVLPAKAGEVSPQSAAKAPKTARIETELRDLDYWSDDPAPLDDDPPDPMPTCSGCWGSGKDTGGGICKICGGTGRIPAEDQPGDDEDENDERKFKEEE